MISLRSPRFPLPAAGACQKLGTVGYLAVFAASITLVMVVPFGLQPLAAGLCLLIAWLVYPQAFGGLMRLRWLVLIGLLCLPPIFLVGEIDRSLVGISYSSTGLESGVQIALRILVVLVSVQGLTRAVDIPSIAGLLEHLGLRGLGFSLGVALNLLPAMHQSAQNVWRSLWMRGGLRKQRLRGLRLLAVTVLTGALSRAEEIALAAEARAFSPEQARSLPVEVGKWDWMVLAGSAALLLGAILAF